MTFLQMNWVTKLLLTTAVSLTIGMRHPVHAQTEPALKFEVVSIKPADPNYRGMGFQRTAGNGLTARGVTLKFLVEFGFDVQDFQVSGGPSWFRSERYDIVAKPERPEGPADIRDATAAQQKVLWDHFRERVRAMLAERFHLTIRRETGERPVYLLTLAKNGHKMQKATGNEGITRDRGKLIGNGATAGMLTNVLSGMLGRPVLNRTGLDGEYQFAMEWAEDSGMKEKVPGEMPTVATPADLPGASIYSAIQEQLGLKLEASKGPVDVIVIERAEKPSAN